MNKFISFIKEFRIYNKKELLDAFASFSRKQLLVFISILFIAICSMVIVLVKVNSKFLVDVPVSGGTVTEGVIGVPTLVNPVIALSDADKDLTALVYSGLMRKTPEGNFIPDLAESFEVSPDGINYTFTIRKDAKFHDGSDVTADDVIFTIEKIKDPIIKSPRKMGWDGISVTKKDDYTVVFTLAQSYISFMDNTTIGILPSKLWKDVDVNEFNLSPLNTKAIGSGPFKIEKVVKDSEGVSKSYELKRFNKFALGSPRIKYLNIISYSNEKDLVKALLNGSIDQAGGISSENAKDIAEDNDYVIHTETLPRIFGIFFNSDKNKIFSDKAVVEAINKAVDRQYIVDQVLGGYGSPVYSPIPEEILEEASVMEKYSNVTIEEANLILEKAGWKLGEDGIRVKTNTTTTTKKVNGKTVKQEVKGSTPSTRLSFSLITGNTPELQKTTQLIKEQLQKIGVEVDIQKVYETGQLNQLIRAREYEALFFGQVINHESDLYSYWNSSQRLDPGLNIAMYNNKKADSILESIQKVLNFDDRIEKYKNLEREFENDIPAILIYSPKYLYITSPTLNNISFESIVIPSDRFSSVYEWSADIDKVWKIFTK